MARTMKTDNQFVYLFYEYNRAINAELTRIVPARWSPEHRTWRFDVTALNRDPEERIKQIDRLLEFASIYQFNVSDRTARLLANLRDAAVAEIEEQSRRLAQSQATHSELIVPLNVKLYPFQVAGVEYATRAKRAIIADDMGLGKTLQAIGLIALVRQSKPDARALIVCPAVVKRNWQYEIERATGERAQVIMNGADLIDPTARTIIINYDLLDKHRHKLSLWKPSVIVADESHYLKNGDAKRTKAFKTIVSASHPEYLLMLTGTPILNRPVELVEPLKILGYLDHFGGWHKYVTYYCSGFKGRFGWQFGTPSPKRLQELNEKLRKLCMVRRLKEDVLSELPDKTRAMVLLPLSNCGEYRAAERDLIQYLRLTAGDDAARRAKRAEHLVRIEKLKQLSANGKLPFVIDWICEFLDSSDKKIVLFAIHRDVIDRLCEALTPYGVTAIKGGDPSDERQRAIERFQVDPQCRVIVCSLHAAGVGITLTAASHVAFVELAWRPADHLQAEDRCHRIGQRENVTAYYLLAEDTIDSVIYRLLQSKLAIVQMATDGEITGDGLIDEVIDYLASVEEKETKTAEV
jgi:SNF2 family DNA or RNA helicase